MKKRDMFLLESLYANLTLNENYNLGSDFVEFNGNYEDDVMFYADYDNIKVKNWIQRDRPLQTKYIAMGQDLVELGMGSVDPKGVYVFNRPTDFTQTALVAVG
jgi:hypothetical protein